MNNSNISTFVFFPESQVGNKPFPVCVCPYKNKDSYTMVEINTGYYKGSIKSITKAYPSYDKLMYSYKRDYNNQSVYPYLNNHIIYNDVIDSKL